MQLYHIAEDISKASGGVRTVVKDIHSQFPTSKVLTTRKDKGDIDIQEFAGSGPWLYSKKLKEHLEKIENTSMLHIHGVWMHAQYTAARIAERRNLPFILSPHGMFEPWLWEQGTIKKKIYFKALAYSAFAKAEFIHAITPNEQKNLQDLFPKTKVICIPNAIEIENVLKKNKPKRPYFLFLGRIHPVKGIKTLIEVFKSLKSLDFDLKIAGPESDYSKELKALSQYDNRIQFLGSVRGEDKKRLYRNAHIFIAPSYSEVVGMVNLEAAMMSTPVITTHQTGLLKEWNENGGSLINPTFDELKDAILESSSWNEEQRELKGNQLRDFVIQEYSWKVNKPKWEALYKMLK